MTEPSDSSPVYRFGVFELDVRSGELRKAGVRLSLPAQSFHVLTALLERPGDLVTRVELRHRLWAGDTFVDFDAGLNAAVKRLRDVLGDSADTPRFIETLPRRGYRFVGLPDGQRHRLGSVDVVISPAQQTNSTSIEVQISDLRHRLLAMPPRAQLVRLLYETEELLADFPYNPELRVLRDRITVAINRITVSEPSMSDAMAPGPSAAPGSTTGPKRGRRWAVAGVTAAFSLALFVWALPYLFVRSSKSELPPGSVEVTGGTREARQAAAQAILNELSDTMKSTIQSQLPGLSSQVVNGLSLQIKEIGDDRVFIECSYAPSYAPYQSVDDSAHRQVVEACKAVVARELARRARN